MKESTLFFVSCGVFLTGVVLLFFLMFYSGKNLALEEGNYLDFISGDEFTSVNLVGNVLFYNYDSDRNVTKIEIVPVSSISGELNGYVDLSEVMMGGELLVFNGEVREFDGEKYLKIKRVVTK